MNQTKHTSAFDVAPRFFDSFLLKDIFDVPAVAYQQNVKFPAVNITANEEAFLVELAAPGLKKENIKVQLEKDVLTISYKEEEKNNQDENNPKSNFLMHEYSNRSFSRSFTFPKGAIDEDKIVAAYVDGILLLELGKQEAAKPKAPRQISIS